MFDLYDAVGHGMWAYSHAAFRVDVLDPERFEPAAGTLVAVTHRRETDVPVICPPLYFAMGGTRRKTGRLHFAARDDMFLPGSSPGSRPSSRCGLRRLLYKVGVAAGSPPSTSSRFAAPRSRASGRFLPPDAARRSTTCWTEGRVVPAASAPRAAVFPAPRGPRRAPRRVRRPPLAADLARGRRRPRGLLGRPAPPRPPATSAPWSRSPGTGTSSSSSRKEGRRRTGRSARSGRDRRARPPRADHGDPPVLHRLRPLVRGRARVHLALGEPVEPPKDDVEGALLGLLRLTMPLTCGQFVATKLEAGAEADPVALERDARRRGRAGARGGQARRARREDVGGRRRRLAEALAIAPRRRRSCRSSPASTRARTSRSWAGSRRRPSSRGKAGLMRIAPMSVTGMTRARAW